MIFGWRSFSDRCWQKCFCSLPLSSCVFVLENHAEFLSNGVFLRGVVQDIGPDCQP